MSLLRLSASLQCQACCHLIHLTEACLADHVQVLHTRDPADRQVLLEVQCWMALSYCGLGRIPLTGFQRHLLSEVPGQDKQ